MSTPSTAIAGIYATICLDADTAAGGLTPGSTDAHAEYFTRLKSGRLEDLGPDGMDRRLHIEYVGTAAWHTLGDMQTFGVTIRVGYFAGEARDATYATMADDEHLIAAALMFSENWTGAAIIVGPASVSPVGDDCFILEIPVDIQLA